MSIGEKRQRVVFERPTETANAFGEPIQTWTALCTSWALVQPLRGAERFSANQVQADVDVRIVTRYRPELATLRPKDRATWNGRQFDIKAVINKDSRNKELEVLAREYV
jgi:SPP1 family predicted phage head-tail adaptor